ncbi:ABC transporter permease [Rosettibacter firmus]|uniref:ABC transporter permease n=1 Tax=Rosettibacter firmus TaxID=3111522 RepID=UPI00336BF28A
MKTLIYFIKKELQQLRRDPKMFLIVLLAPVLQTILLGYAATFDVNNVNIIVFDQDKSIQSRKYIEKLIQSGYFTLKKYSNNYREIEEYILSGNAVAGIVIPNNFEKNLSNNVPTKLQVIVDGSDGTKGSIATGYIQAITSDYSQEIISRNAAKKGIAINLTNIQPATRIWYNPELKTRVFMVPAITALLLMIMTMLLTSLAIVKEKEVGTLEQLIVTPIKPWQLIVGKILPFIIISFVIIILVNSVMVFWFRIPIKGNIILFILASFTFILSTLGLGLFVSTISKTQQQAMMVTVFGVMMPMIYFSGFVFPIENMPKIIQYITYIIPLKYFLIIIRGVILKGNGFVELWKELVILFIMGVFILLISTKRFHKKLG